MKATFNKLTKTTCLMAPFQNTEQHYVIVYQPYLTLRFSLNFKHELM